MIIIKLIDKIYTDLSGYNRLINFYHEAKNYHDDVIHICIKELSWMDANFSALLDAILHKLHKENRLTFTIDFELASSRFNVLLRNGFLKSETPVLDVQNSTLPNMNFSIDDQNPYIKYLEERLLKHRAFPNKYHSEADSMIDQLIEIFCNSHHHSGTKYPFFVSGQYFPKGDCLIFTMVDLGEGFLPRISKTDLSVQDSLQAIQWALKKGNSTKLTADQTPGGLGIASLLKYCSDRNGGIQIITGDGYWNSEDSGTIFPNGRKVNRPFVGTTVNLFLRR